MASSYWLVKSEPSKYAYADLERDGKTVWDGVRNFAAASHLKAMKTLRSIKEELVSRRDGDDRQLLGD